MNRLLAILSAWLMTAPVLAWAQETVPEQALEGAIDEAVHEEVVQHEGGGGLPQFNPDTWPSQIFWLAVSFTFLYFFFAKFILPRLGSTIEARANKIETDIKTAEALSAQAEQIRLGYEAELKRAAGKASSDMKEIDEAAKAKLASSLADFRKKYENEVAAVESRLEQSKVAAMGDMQSIAADIAAQAAEKIAGIKADSAQAQSVVQSLKNKAA